MLDTLIEWLDKRYLSVLSWWVAVPAPLGRWEHGIPDRHSLLRLLTDSSQGPVFPEPSRGAVYVSGVFLD